MSAYARPTDLTEALTLLARGYRILAGGTDVYPSAAATLKGDTLDITALPMLSGIRQGNGLRIGAATTWTTIAEATLPPALAALQHAARTIGGHQIQNAATIGGNLTNASPAADGIPPLLILDAEVELTSLHTTRRIPLLAYLIGPRRVDLRTGELLTAILIPEAAVQGRSIFAKLGARSHLVISIAMIAVRIVTLGDRITQACAAVGACSATAQRLAMVEAALLGPSHDAAGRLHPDQLASLCPIDDIRATASYRRDAALELVRRAVQALTR